ncbi:flagellar assembly protein FliW [bacterium]|nr:flagellar assembly protein FliW [bacterium]
MKFNTTRFGEIDVPEQDIITFPNGILGFSESLRYVILNDPATDPLRWLQSIDDGELAFVIIDPIRFRPEYSLDLSDGDVSSLQLENPDEAMIYSIVVIPKDDPQRMTANLQGPLVINAIKMIAKQVISTSPRHKLKHFILDEMEAMIARKANNKAKAEVKLHTREASNKAGDR